MKMSRFTLSIIIVIISSIFVFGLFPLLPYNPMWFVGGSLIIYVLTCAFSMAYIFERLIDKLFPPKTSQTS